ncbi:hypothetical protein BZB76_0048 [Actinomadura pelletieri DSM 43383]|uniref:Uncharacterized protein n=1 Tax=Actinomadura pelletieri DSM 43383 TaxID=1120940 RepID=A0A495QWT1_9ACTN|nr:hypothetical protein [Actinomadura pelletieri]RKS78631.1 hypothetical protein BZB76_0048 [Actinomadura pelletieri DSM 43383]
MTQDQAQQTQHPPREQALPEQDAREQEAPREQAPQEQEAAPGQKRGMLTALDALADQAEITMKIVRSGLDDLPLSGVVDALEFLMHNVEVLHQMVSAVNERAAQIREREVTERPAGTALETMDSALVTLGYGQETAMSMHRLLSLGRRELVLVDEGEV